MKDKSYFLWFRKRMQRQSEFTGLQLHCQYKGNYCSGKENCQNKMLLITNDEIYEMEEDIKKENSKEEDCRDLTFSVDGILL